MDMTTFDKAGYEVLTALTESPAPPVWRGHRATGEGTALHFLHGNGFCGGVYWPFLSRFLPQHALFCSDIEGHGASEAPAQNSGAEAVLVRARQVIAEQGLDRALLVGMGHSYGAALTLRLAADHPQLFRAVVLLDPIVMPPPLWAGVRLSSLLGRNPIAQGARRRRERWPSREAALQHLQGRGIYAGWTLDAMRCFVDHALTPTGNGEEVRLACPRDIEATIFEHPIWPWRAFRRLQCPALFVYGESSYPFFPWAHRLAKAANPRIQFRRLPGGHCFMQQDPARAHEVVAEFLQQQGL